MPLDKPIPNWPSTKAKRALAAVLRIGWRMKRQSGTSHRILERPGWPDVLFAYHDRVTLGPAAMRVLAKKTGLTPDDLVDSGERVCSLGRLRAEGSILPWFCRGKA